MATNSLTRDSRGSDLTFNHLIDIFFVFYNFTGRSNIPLGTEHEAIKNCTGKEGAKSSSFIFSFNFVQGSCNFLLSYVMNSSLLELINLC